MKEKAKALAAKAHEGQKRKNSGNDYIVHPIQVAKTLESSGYNDDVICAGYLHDVVEDTEVTIEDIEKEFGPKVKALVAAHTEDKSKAWRARKQHTIDTVKNGSKEVKALIIADKLDNLHSLQSEMWEKGAAVWEAFNAGYDQQKWYNQCIAEAMDSGLHPNEVPAFFHEFRELVKQTFNET